MKNRWLLGGLAGLALAAALAILVGVSYQSGQNSQHKVDALDCEQSHSSNGSLVLSLESRHVVTQGFDTVIRTINVGDCDRITESALKDVLDALAGKAPAGSSPANALTLKPCPGAPSETAPPTSAPPDSTALGNNTITDCVVVSAQPVGDAKR